MKFSRFYALLIFSPVISSLTPESLSGGSHGVAYAADKKAEPAAAASPEAPVGPKIPPEVICQTEVSYTWKPFPPEPKKTPGADQTPPADPAPKKEFYSKVVRTGEDKADVERMLKSDLPVEEGKAMAACEEAHHNTGGCIATRIEVLGARYREFDFETKRSLRKKFAEDCIRIAGDCIKAESTEAKCVEKLPPAPVAPEAPAVEDKKKK